MATKLDWYFCRSYGFLLFFGLLFTQWNTTRSQLSGRITIRYCVPENLREFCDQMALTIPGSIKCISARDKLDCMNMIYHNEADVINLDAEDIYLAGKVSSLEPFVREEFGTREVPYQTKAAVLIKRSSKIRSLTDLRGKRTCHSGYGTEVGWSIPIGTMARKLNLFAFDCRGELQAISTFFNASCVPGRWSNDLLVDRQLKKQHDRLCSLCRDPINCSPKDDYFGEDGAVRCVVNGDGEVAFTTLDAIVEFFNSNRKKDREDYMVLCLDGSSEQISSESCDWGFKPSNAFVIKRGRIYQSRLFARYLEDIHFRSPNNPAARPAWFNRVFVSSNDVTNLRYLEVQEQNYTDYLGNYIYSIDKSNNQCDEMNVTFCVSSLEEIEKCLDLAKVALVRKVGPFIRCLGKFTKEECIEEVKMQRADLINLSPFDFYNASRYNGLKPIGKEINNLNGINSYALAVVRTPSDVISFEMLRNVTSCHSGYNTPAGWLYPVSVLVKKGLVDPTDCNRAYLTSDFFTSSCVPGASSIANPPLSGFVAAKLCRLCVGDERGSDVCEYSNRETFFKDEGALRCLQSGRGDVAFVDSSFFLKYIRGHHMLLPSSLSTTSSQPKESRNPAALSSIIIRPEHFRLVCRYGGQRRIEDFEFCNLGKIPPSYLATSTKITYDRYLEVVHLLSKLSVLFGQTNRDSFNLFGIYKQQSDLMFSDNTVSIEAMEYTSNYRDALGEFLDVFEDSDVQVCNSSFAFYRFHLIVLIAYVLVPLLYSSWSFAL